MSQRSKEIYKATIVGSIGNLLLVIFKLAAGVLGHSAAMIADGIHSLSDFVTDIIVIAFVKVSGKPRDIDHQYGHGKYETLASALIGLMLMGVGVWIFWNGITAIWGVLHGNILESPGILALIAALVSIGVKESMYHYTILQGRKLQSQAVIANAWHHRSDAFSSVATAAGIAGAMILGSRWTILDPLAAMVVSVLIVKAAVMIFVPSINELLEKSLPEHTEREILNIIAKYPAVQEPHNLRTRRIGPVCSVEMHIRVDGSMSVHHSHEITRHIEADIKQLLGSDTLINIHVEPKK